MASDEDGTGVRMEGEVAVGADGVRIAGGAEVSRESMSMIRHFIPGPLRARAALTDRVVKKLRDGERLSEAEEEFAVYRLGEDAARFVRLERIEARALLLLEESANSHERAAGRLGERGAEDGARTSADWLNKFRDDAGLVDDAIVAEVYAQILAGEALEPGSVSLRTLRVLRYMDKSTAEVFAKLVGGVVDGSLPRNPFKRGPVHTAAAVTYDELLSLSDAGLILLQSQNETYWTAKRSPICLGLDGSESRIELQFEVDGPIKFEVSTYPLTEAGAQLARVARVPRSDERVDAIVDILRTGRPTPTRIRLGQKNTDVETWKELWTKEP